MQLRDRISEGVGVLPDPDPRPCPPPPTAHAPPGTTLPPTAPPLPRRLSTETVVNATNAGYRAIWSVDGKYYLDALNEPWTSFYDVDILAGQPNVTAQQLILGGETEMWGETVRGGAVLFLGKSKLG